MREIRYKIIDWLHALCIKRDAEYLEYFFCFLKWQHTFKYHGGQNFGLFSCDDDDDIESIYVHQFPFNNKLYYVLWKVLVNN